MGLPFAFWQSPISSTYFPVDTYSLWVYNSIGTVGNSSSTRNIKLRNDSTNAEQDFLFDGTPAGKTAIINWLSGAVGKVVTLYNEGLGGSNHNFNQTNPSNQPIFDTTLWLVDYNGANLYSETSLNSPILGSDSTVLASFKTQNELKVGGYFEEHQTNARYISIMSDTLNTLSSALDYRLGGLTEINYTSQTQMNVNKVITMINDTNVYSVYDGSTLIGSISEPTPFSGNANFNLGYQTRDNNQFTGFGKGIIIHNGLLSASTILKLQTHIAI